MLRAELPADAALPAFLDVEASGFGRDSYPVEVGFVLPDGRSHCTLIRPEPQWTHWDPQAEQMHHISRSSALRHGKEPAAVARMLNDELHGRTVYSDGWLNDYTWLGVLFEAANMVPAFKLESLRRLLSEDEADHWHEVKLAVGSELHLQRHRASADARLLQLTLHRLRSSVTPAS
jgi:hypothetical protein